MQTTRTVLVKSFRVKRPSGQKDIVDVYQTYISAASMSNPNAELPGPKSAKLRNGRSVNHVNETTFKDIFPEEELVVIEEI